MPVSCKKCVDPCLFQVARFSAHRSSVQLNLIQQNPQLAQSLLSSDPRMIDVLGALMRIDMQGFSRPEGSDELPPGVPPSAAFAASPPSSPPSSARPPAASSTRATHSDDVKMAEVEEVDDGDAAAKAAAEAEKKLGAEAYKKRDFAEAITHFSKAWETWPKDVTFLTNLGGGFFFPNPSISARDGFFACAAAYFEQAEYDKSIETCQKAVDEGRDVSLPLLPVGFSTGLNAPTAQLRVDYKLIAKAYGRIGSAYAKKEDPASAIRFFEKSLSEHRTPDILNKLKDIERAKAAADRAAYIDPAQSAAAREEGNRLFKEGDFAGAVKSYTESIRRDPSDARGYNNRALAYTKLVAFPEALKDVEEAIRVDPVFGKQLQAWCTVR
jgi:stress-induced-phosphoprotein 1